MAKTDIAPMGKTDIPPMAKTDIAPKPVFQPKQSVMLIPPAAVLTVKEPPARGWLPKFALACALLIALGWSAAHLDIAKRFMGLWQGIPAAEKSPPVPTSGPVSLDPAGLNGPGNLSSGPNSEAPTDDKNPGMPERGGVQSTLPSREPN